ncbi:MAG: hypothetical protein P9M08_05165 [Candidatus Erginobacter occultus]|nr:hypothetical protein [Candidatus Erginobacter occultus]
MTGKLHLPLFLLGALFLLARPLIPQQHQLLSSLRHFLAVAALFLFFSGAAAFRLRHRPDRLIGFFRRWFLAATVAGTLVLGLLLLWLVRLNFSSPLFLIDHVEKTLYLQALNIAQDGSLPYPPPNRLPLIFDAYNPLFQYLLALLIRIFSPGTAAAKSLAVSFSAFLIGRFLLTAIKLRLNRYGLVLAVFAFLAASPPAYLVWARNDSMLAFLIAGFICQLYRARRLQQYLLCLPWLYLAFMTKQTGLLWAGFAVTVILYRRSGRRDLPSFCAGGLLLLGATVFLFNLASKGNYAFWTVTLPARHPMKPPAGIIEAVLAFLPFRLLPLPLALTALTLLRAPKKARCFLSRVLNREETPLIYFGGAAVYGVLIGLLPLAKTGGLDNSFLPVLFPLALATGLLGQAIFRIGKESSSPYFPAAAALILSLVVLFSTVSSASQTIISARRIRLRSGAVSREQLKEIAGILRERGISRAFFPPSREPGPGEERFAGLQEYFAHRFGYYLDEAALKDYLAAGFSFPDSFNRALAAGEMEAIVVRSGQLPFFGTNPYGRWSTARADRELYPPAIRETFHRFFRLGQSRADGYDIYEYTPGEKSPMPDPARF